MTQDVRGSDIEGPSGASSLYLISLFVLYRLARRRQSHIFWMFLSSHQGRLPQFAERPAFRGGTPMECPSCKADAPDGSKFCNDCGAGVTIRCVACGAQNRAGSKFCFECGASLAAPTAGSLAATPTVASALQQSVSSYEGLDRPTTPPALRPSNSLTTAEHHRTSIVQQRGRATAGELPLGLCGRSQDRPSRLDRDSPDEQTEMR
jgi:hypothetical protein